ncbi:hypothetical protein F2Q70_00007228 [Brassica cretica]|uniref:Uncharacterized protein n=1 Tax=Brassica cretica TaxID=69181 RepID=A0A8S9LZM5_BRACR|nr:hypothetical protein F2Q70_00007228 [Brassica cretica]
MMTSTCVVLCIDGGVDKGRLVDGIGPRGGSLSSVLDDQLKVECNANVSHSLMRQISCGML